MSQRVTVRGGRPRIFWPEGITTEGKYIKFKDAGGAFTSNHVTIANIGGEVMRVYFTEADFTEDAALDAAPKRYVPLAASSSPGIAPGGYYEAPDELEGVWLRAEANTTDAHIIARAMG